MSAAPRFRYLWSMPTLSRDGFFSPHVRLSAAPNTMNAIDRNKFMDEKISHVPGPPKHIPLMVQYGHHISYTACYKDLEPT